MTQLNSEQIKGLLIDKGIDLTCAECKQPHCANAKVDLAHVTMGFSHDNYGNLSELKFAETILLNCTNCGHVRQFYLEHLVRGSAYEGLLGQ